MRETSQPGLTPASGSLGIAERSSSWIRALRSTSEISMHNQAGTRSGPESLRDAPARSTASRSRPRRTHWSMVRVLLR